MRDCDYAEVMSLVMELEGSTDRICKICQAYLKRNAR
ncbi:hypothetical protein WC7_03562 [Citrobacter sp. KTE151]|nr:hypothetical protein WC7_03562 [Citrobacter sp. KTE151]